MRNPEQTGALLLVGPPYYSETRPLTSRIKGLFLDVDPLGIAIVSAFLKRRGIETRLLTMYPGKISQLESAIENAGSVWLSSRFFDISLARQVIKIAQKCQVPVISGGYGPTFNQEAFEDTTIVQGEAETVLDQVIEDWLCQKLNPLYDARLKPPFNLRDYVHPDRTIFRQFPFGLEILHKHPIEFQRGCPNKCTFCSPTRLQKGVFRVREVTDIIGEIEQMGLKPGDFLFCSDINTTAIPRDTLIEIFQYLKTKNIRWFTEGTVSTLIEDLIQHGENNSFLKLMSPLDGKGGCYTFLYGADDLSVKRIAGSHDKVRSVLNQAAKIFRKFGIPLHLSFVIGLDHHTFPDSIFQIWSVLEDLNLPFAFFQTATPYKGTPWGDRVYREGRVLDHEPLHYNHHQTVFKPNKMTPEELDREHYWLRRRMFNPSNIIHSTRANMDNPFVNSVLTLFQTCLPLQIEAYLSLQELTSKGVINTKIQKELDQEYEAWKRKQV